ncbi:uncharacterized protein KD926_007765 [Aspergillus affinis]|uniref:uncharacterized protein n=1 Tax=Aspergillus affinis TaxID=1070780 RepID=UPI0022FF322A|nr:uncharacterized protein KD926_007765 [Aspergillus affinis]KAI9040685.1 hypothetical protein KD926_007765 [Aspergillus affinis]
MQLLIPGWKPTDAPVFDPERKLDFSKKNGRLNWLLKTRPDIKFPVYRVLRKNMAPNENDMNATLTIFRFLIKNPESDLVLGRDPEGPLYGYIDLSHADCEKSRSTEAFIFFYRGPPIFWQSKKQSIVAPISSIAESIAWDATTKQAM